ncbi:MAG: DNA-directed DNA polymerase alpha subunit pol12 [Pycnora praestabilis]|nr:MAG: DNA-directed DNA polymerase alpha subunit pol12 [Pycnora praestabilis]
MEEPAVLINELFSSPLATELSPDVEGELQSILRLHSISPQELFYKWESYSLKMGSEETKLNLDTVRAFKKDVQEGLERETRGKSHVRSVDKMRCGETPRTTTKREDVFGMLDGLVPQTPTPDSTSRVKRFAQKRKADFDTLSLSKSSKEHRSSSPVASQKAHSNGGTNNNGAQHISFVNRANPSQIMETLNNEMPLPEPRIAPSAEPRVKLVLNTDLKKFSYRPMAMRLSEASEVLDDRLDDFLSLVQAHNGLDDAAFGNPASQSTNEVVAVGRIACDTLEGKLNAASLILETSRRMGAGIRVPLKVDSLPSFGFFPGQVVALRGVNASGAYFSVKAMLEVPLLPVAASTPSALEVHNDRLSGGSGEKEEKQRPLNILIGSGPYTTDEDLVFESLQAICDQAATTSADALILNGPFLDIEHPLLASGDFDLPSDSMIDPDVATIASVFRALVSAPLRRLTENVPSITIVLIPSVRDAISKHVSWPQESFTKKTELGLPKQVKLLTNPSTFSLNEIIIGISAQDVLYELRKEEVVGGNSFEKDTLARTSRYLIEQRHFFPLFPPVERRDLPKTGVEGGLATGTPLDTSYLKLGEWLNVRPDVLITPSALPPFAKVIESVLVINPGTLSKRKGAGTHARMTMHPAALTLEEKADGKMVAHKVFERARVDVMKI